VVTVRIWLIHSVRSTAVGWVQEVRPTSSYRPTVFSQRRRPLKVDWSSSRRVLVRPDWPIAARTVLLMVVRAVALAQSASVFQKPQPPTLWRV
jgi:hypothetical protein